MTYLESAQKIDLDTTLKFSEISKMFFTPFFQLRHDLSSVFHEIGTRILRIMSRIHSSRLFQFGLKMPGVRFRHGEHLVEISQPQLSIIITPYHIN
jgi:hypothetical protein